MTNTTTTAPKVVTSKDLCVAVKGLQVEIQDLQVAIRELRDDIKLLRISGDRREKRQQAHRKVTYVMHGITLGLVVTLVVLFAIVAYG